MRNLLKTLSVISCVAIVAISAPPPSVTITRQPCDSSVCVSVPGVTPLPPGGSVVSSQDFNSSDGGCTVNNINDPFEGPWTYNSGPGTWSTAGQGPELGRAPSTRLTCPSVTVTQAGNVLVAFNHRYSFEDGNWDGGQFQVSVNGGVFVAVPSSAFVQNGYNGSLLGNTAAELAGQAGFVNVSSNYAAGAFITSIADLGCLSAGDTVAVRFLAAFDTNTRNGNPAWEIDSLSLTQGAGSGTTAEFIVSVLPVAPGDSLSFQWQRNNGAGFQDISGANSGFLVFTPALADNGACFRAIVTATSGGAATSSVACLTVIQPNTAPRFTCGTNQIAPQNSGPQTVPGWAANIVPDSLPPLDTIIKFNAIPPNSQLFGAAAVSGGVLHLTDTVGNAFGALALNLPATTVFQTFSASWQSLVGGGGGGADGYSFNVGDNLPYPPTYGDPAEEGTSSGLSITLDTWDNGAPDIVGIEIRWQGTRVASAAIPKDNDGSGVFLRKNTFVAASLTVDATGLATFNYDGTVISAQLPGYTGISANRLMFAARTGGANDNHWIDNLTGSSWINNFLAVEDNPALAEQNQTISFFVSNDNPSLFSSQPAISSAGTLTYTPAPNACGTANVTVVARDNGGTSPLCGGNDTSTPCNFTINVTCVNQPPTARIIATPLADFSPVLPNPVLIAANAFDACLVLDASSSSPTNGLTYAWFLAPSPTPIASGVLVTNCTRLGTHTYLLVVTDTQGATATASLTIDVLTPCEAAGALILIIQDSALPRNVQHTLITNVKGACASYEKFGLKPAINQLQTFQNKVDNRVRPLDADLADQLEHGAQVIVDALQALADRLGP